MRGVALADGGRSCSRLAKASGVRPELYLVTSS